MQSEAEREHLMEDRARLEEVHKMEKELWGKERSLYLARIGELEAELEKARKHSNASPAINPDVSLAKLIPDSLSLASPDSSTTSRVSSRFDVPQESGRNPDGTPFYAPAPANPKRTFEHSEASNLTVDDMLAPRADPFTITSKYMTAADFVKSPPADSPDHSPKKRKTDTPPESIDISHIQPELEGIAIKTTALEPAVVAKILSPKGSPLVSSPTSRRNGSNGPSINAASPMSPQGGKTKENKPDTLQVASQPVEHRLVMHAGHTPNHSLSRINLLKEEESATATPRQIHQPLASIAQNDGSPDGNQPLQASYLIPDDEDPSLNGPLHLPSEPSPDEPFVDVLFEKLEAHRKSQNSSPVSSSNESESKPRDAKSDDGEGPKLKLKPSMNFGRPFGQA